MPFSTRAHPLTLNEHNNIFLEVSALEHAMIAMQVIEGNVENPLHFVRISSMETNSQAIPM
jgi:hypothetical protein